MLETNLFGVLNGITTLLPVMKAQTASSPPTSPSADAEAAIVITGSKQGITNPPGSSVAYNASKAAAKTVAEQLDHSLRGTPIAVHLLVPGFTWTRLAGGVAPSEKPAAAWWPHQVADYLEARMRERQFWVLCPDGDVDEETDRRRMLVSFLFFCLPYKLYLHHPPPPKQFLLLLSLPSPVSRKARRKKEKKKQEENASITTIQTNPHHPTNQWTADDAVKGRPPLSRWRDEYKEEFEAWMKKGAA